MQMLTAPKVSPRFGANLAIHIIPPLSAEIMAQLPQTAGPTNDIVEIADRAEDQVNTTLNINSKGFSATMETRHNGTRHLTSQPQQSLVSFVKALATEVADFTASLLSLDARRAKTREQIQALADSITKPIADGNFSLVMPVLDVTEPDATGGIASPLPELLATVRLGDQMFSVNHETFNSGRETFEFMNISPDQTLSSERQKFVMVRDKARSVTTLKACTPNEHNLAEIYQYEPGGQDFVLPLMEQFSAAADTLKEKVFASRDIQFPITQTLNAQALARDFLLGANDKLYHEFAAHDALVKHSLSRANSLLDTLGAPGKPNVTDATSQEAYGQFADEAGLYSQEIQIKRGETPFSIYREVFRGNNETYLIRNQSTQEHLKVSFYSPRKKPVIITQLRWQTAEGKDLGLRELYSLDEEISGPFRELKTKLIETLARFRKTRVFPKPPKGL